jgi:hypothetical protein
MLLAESSPRELLVSLLLGVAERPSSREVAARARDATACVPATSSASQLRHQPAMQYLNFRCSA